jgi:hypothetical protein
MFSIKNVLKKGDVLSSLLFNIASEYPIKRVELNKEGLILSGAH